MLLHQKGTGLTDGFLHDRLISCDNCWPKNKPQQQVLEQLDHCLGWLSMAFDVLLNQFLEEWHQVAVRFRRANGIRDGDRERSIWSLFT